MTPLASKSKTSRQITLVHLHVAGPTGSLAGAVGGEEGAQHAGDGRAGAGEKAQDDLLNNVRNSVVTLASQGRPHDPTYILS